jgi:hypothetical protein
VNMNDSPHGKKIELVLAAYTRVSDATVDLEIKISHPVWLFAMSELPFTGSRSIRCSNAQQWR